MEGLSDKDLAAIRQAVQRARRRGAWSSSDLQYLRPLLAEVERLRAEVARLSPRRPSVRQASLFELFDERAI